MGCSNKLGNLSKLHLDHADTNRIYLLLNDFGKNPSCTLTFTVWYMWEFDYKLRSFALVWLEWDQTYFSLTKMNPWFHKRRGFHTYIYVPCRSSVQKFPFITRTEFCLSPDSAQLQMTAVTLGPPYIPRCSGLSSPNRRTIHFPDQGQSIREKVK